MIFYTHDGLTHKKTSKHIFILSIICAVFIYGFFLFTSVVCSIYVHNIESAVVILSPISLCAAWFVIGIKDAEKEYVEFIKDTVIVVDYRFGIRREKIFSTEDIVEAEIVSGFSNKVRGHRFSHVGVTYIVFRGVHNKYLFKIVNLPETKSYFESYLIKSELQKTEGRE